MRREGPINGNVLWWIAGGIVALCVIGYFGAKFNVPIGKPDHGPQITQKAQAATNAQKQTEVIGQVVSTPLIATGSGHIAYAVYVKELNGARCLDAENCPLLAVGDRVVMTQNHRLTDWYFYVRPAK